MVRRRWKGLLTAVCCRSLPLYVCPATVLHFGRSARGQQGLLTWFAAGDVGVTSGLDSERKAAREGGVVGERGLEKCLAALSPVGH